MNRFLLLLACCGVILASGAVHGLWTDRWQSSQDLDEALARVPCVPMKLGDWEGENLEVDPVSFASAGAQAYWMRRYQNSKTGQYVSVILMCGRGGRMSVHTPDVCYRGAGYDLTGQAKRITIPIKGWPAAELWSGNFAKDKTLAAAPLRLYWTWGRDGAWQAPDYPRYTFRGQPALYKLYVIRQYMPEMEAPDADPGVAFLQELLPQLDETLFAKLPF